MSQLLRSNIEKRIKLNDAEWAAVLAIMKPRTIKRKELLLKAGDICEHNSFIIKGCLRTFFTDEKSNEHIFQLGVEDWWSSDLMSYVTGEPAHFSIDALEDTEVLQMHRRDFDALLLSFPVFERFFRLLMQGAYVAGQRRMIDNMSYSAERRYLDFIKKFPAMEMRVAQHHIASYLGITPEALSRIKRGIIEKSRTNG